MESINLPKVKEEIISDNLSIITIEPLFPGYGHTLGNALRRVLLSSIPGAAITSFKIEGATHEFTSLPHVKEDLIEIMLNIKSIKIKSFSNEKIKLSTSPTKSNVVTAGDLSKNSEVIILNPEQIIATLDKNAKFNLEVTVERDRGFRQTDNTEKGKEIGEILIDTSFSPVERVKIDVQNTRVGQMTNYDKLITEITTNGSISPKEAVVDASNILIEHYKAFAFNEEPKEQLVGQYQEPVEEDDYNYSQNEDGEVPVAISENLDSKAKIDEVGLAPRTSNALINAGIKTLAGLQRLSELKLSEIKGLGKKGVEEIKVLLEKNENN